MPSQFINLISMAILLFILPFYSGSIVAEQEDFDKRKQQQFRAHDFDVKHYRIALSFDEPSRSFDGETAITFSSTVEGLNTLNLDAENITISRVTNEAGAVLKFTQSKDKLVIFLESSLAKSKTTTLIITYRASNLPPDPRFGFFRDKTDVNPQLINASNFPEGARNWFPSFDHPADWATHETFITVKEDYKVLANGALISDIKDKKTGRHTVHWSQVKPQPTYLYVFIAGPYSVLNDNQGDLPLHYWVYPGDEVVAKQAFSDSPRMITFFEDLYDTQFPWVKYDQIIVPGIGGGAESTSATLLGNRVINYEREGEQGASDWLLAHEIAHQWWGDMIGYQDWKHIWLAESFATHGEYLYIDHAFGADEGAFYLNLYKNDYLSEANTKFIRPIVTAKWDEPNDMFDRHTYEKGGVILNMFRELVGHETFGHILKSFLKTHAYTSTTTSDFFDTVKQVTNKDYSWFFNQWLLSPGHPVLDVSYHWDAKLNKLSMTIKQTQDTSQGIPIFRLPIKIAITTKSGKKVENIWLKEKLQTYSFAVDSEPLMVHFDEGDLILKEWTLSKSTEELLYQAVHDQMMGRLWAIGELEKHLSEKDIASHLLKIALNDSFWAVREKALLVLSTIQQVNLVSEIKSIVVDDPDAKVRAAAIKILGGFDDTNLSLFFLERYKVDSNNRSKTALIIALGRFKDSQYESVFKEAMLSHTVRKNLEKAAKTALEALTTE